MEWGGVAPLLLDEVDIMHATGFFQLLERTRVDKKTNNWSVDLMYIYIYVSFFGTTFGILVLSNLLCGTACPQYQSRRTFQPFSTQM